MVSSGWWACCLVAGIFGEEYLPQARTGALVTIDYATAVADGAVHLCEGYRASGVAYCDNRE
jgi:hypothetical protein